MNIAPPRRQGRAYWCYDPSLRKPVNLRTWDFEEAKKRQRELWVKAGRIKGGSVAPVSNEPPKDTTMSETPVTAAATPSLDAASIINNWAASQATPEPEITVAQPGNASGGWSSEPDVQPLSSSDTDIVPVKRERKPKPGELTPEQSAKIGAGLKGMATRINVVVIGWGVSVFGRDPVPPEEEEVELLKLGWEMMIEQWFVKNTAEPWMLIVIGNLMLAVSTFVRSPKRPKPTKADLKNVSPIEPAKAS